MKKILPLLAALVFVTGAAHAQLEPVAYARFTPDVPSVASATTITLTNPASVFVRKDRGMAIIPTFVAANAGTSNVVFTFEVSADGTNFTTTGPVSVTAVANGTNTVRHYSLIPPTTLNNVRYIRLHSIQNAQTNAITLSGVLYSYFN